MPKKSAGSRAPKVRASARQSRDDSSHPHERLIHSLLRLPRTQVRSIARVVIMSWALEDSRKTRPSTARR